MLDFGKLISSGPTDRGAARRARDPRVPRDRGERLSDATRPDALQGRADSPSQRGGRAVVRKVRHRDPGRRGHGAARTERSGQVQPRARGRRHPAADGRARSSSAAPTSRASGRSASGAPGVAIVPEGRRLLPRADGGGQHQGGDVHASRETRHRRGGHARSSCSQSCRSAWTHPARALSGGEQQMVVLAQALVSQPKFILIDELSLGPRAGDRQPADPDDPRDRRVGDRRAADRAVRDRGTRPRQPRATSWKVGGIQFSGAAKELRENPELLHTAYLLRGSNGAARTPAVAGGEPAT